MADLARDEGDHEAAHADCERSLAIHREVGNRRWEGMTLETLAAIEGDLGRHEEARELFDRSLAIHEELGNRRHAARTLVSRAALERRTGDLAAAGALLERAGRILDEIGEPQTTGECACELAELAIARGEDPGPFLARAREIAARLGVGPHSRISRQISRLESGER
jgi:tetratricopeptide (TPR) repeat protein